MIVYERKRREATKLSEDVILGKYVDIIRIIYEINKVYSIGIAHAEKHPPCKLKLPGSFIIIFLKGVVITPCWIDLLLIAVRQLSFPKTAKAQALQK